MPIYISIQNNKGQFYGGLIQGYCDYYDSDKKIVKKGYFVNNNLTGPNNIIINYTDMTFKYYLGTFINNKLDGDVIIYQFNGINKILDDINQNIIVKKSNCKYSKGNLISINSSKDVNVNISVDYQIINEIKFMIKFTLIEI
jgi:hypothetical protein